MSAYDRAVGGKLNLKGAVPLLKQELKKKKKKKKVKGPDEGEEGVEGPAEGLEGPSEGAEGTELTVVKKEGAVKEVKKDLGGIDIMAPGKGYEQLFPYESQRAKEAKGRSQCYGTNYRAAPEILHGYNRKVKGDTHEERLDMRCGQKADKHCK
mmetsp:Transcript_38727/g.65197  ORF Transcript_38727/g.65197 Transcript_38727/m.65197 type:complete len:153 (-) Transcript_38727:236-694(-)|eukprot:CAMPEP_0198199112 /NCGR_PEP_ID=MMETSP1445-20131203/2442_1 /TAXON_ID=36898 /ORGANISM="Pyramimonas sp., Strain CCMP2087" /LENGTH=152 /DNA_ID=CAMNT_0043868853 /DNA_START=114 /DNA_END=572 /DNA_ORIENTATION=-